MATKQHHTPPRFFQALLGWLLRDDWDTPLGDFEEYFNHLAATRSPFYARWWYRLQVLRLFPGRIYEKFYWSIAMLKNYITVALRSLGRQKGFAALNIIGLAVGLACCLLIGTYVHHETTYDQHHEHADRIYRVVYKWERSIDPPRPALDEFGAWGAAAPGPALEEDFAAVEQAVRFSGGHSLLLTRDDISHVEENYYFADSTVFSMFDFSLTQGNPETVLTAPNTLVVTESIAQKYFGTENPMGKSVLIDGEQPLTITGVMEDLPAGTHFNIDMLISMPTFEDSAPDYVFSWGYVDFFTYIKVAEDYDINALRAQMPAFTMRHVYPDPGEREITVFIDFEPLADAYLSYKNDHTTIGPQGNAANLRIFQLAGFFILIIACINYMNLATARSLDRAREVGMRKVLGSQRRTLIGQFLMESILVVVFAMIIAFGLALVSAPLLALVSGAYFPTYLLFNPVTIAIALALAVVVGILAGSYPAFILSAFNPIKVIKGAFKRTRQGIVFRRSLVLGQFSISLILLISTFVVYDQIRFMQKQELGFEQEQQLLLNYGFDGEVNENLLSYLETWESLPAVRSAAASRSVPGSYRPNANALIEDASGEFREETFQVFEIDYDFIDQFNLELVAGRGYSRDFATDTTQALVLTESAARLYGYTDPADIVGKRFEQWGSAGRVIGVVKDFHHQSLHQQIAPLSLRLSPFSSQYFILQLDAADLQQTLADIENIWMERIPHRPFLYSFLDETFDAQYQSEERFGALIGIFAGLAIFIACLGLFGTAAYSAQQRTKEIGIRKVLGASVVDIVRLLSREVMMLISVAFLVSVPLAYIGLNRWLDTFSYHTSMNVLIFLTAGVVLLLVTMLTISYQTLRVATAAPVKSMRYE